VLQPSRLRVNYSEDSLVFGDVANIDRRETVGLARWKLAQAAEHKRAAV
jgi:hypothetical protein